MTRAGAAVAVLLGVVLVVPRDAHAHGNPKAEARATVSGKTVAIDYHQPSLKGRDLLSQVRVGDHWRMGADEPTMLSSPLGLAFGATVVPAGEYVLTARKVAETAWVLTFHRPSWMFIHRWPFFITIPGAPVADVPLTLSTSPQPVEMFVIELKGAGNRGDLEMRWGGAVLRTSFLASP